MNQGNSDTPMREVRAGTMRRRGPGARLAVLYFAAAVLVAAFLVFEDRPRHHQMLAAVYGLRHVLLLGFGGLMVLELTALLGRRWIRKRSLYYLVTVLIVALAAVRIEFNHPPWELGRYLRNLAGGAAFLLLSAVFDRPLRREHDRLRGRPRQVLAWAALLMLVTVFRPLYPVALAYAGRSGDYPVIMDLTEDWQAPFVETRNAMVFIGAPPPGWPERRGRTTAMVSFERGPAPSAVIVDEPYPDWRGFNTLRFQIFSDLEAPVILLLRIGDSREESAPGDRFETGLVVSPGLNDYEIPFRDIGDGPEDRSLDLSRIRRITLLSGEPPGQFRVFVSGMRLVERREPGNAGAATRGSQASSTAGTRAPGG